MPINIPGDLPAAGVLERENIFVMTRRRAQSQDIRPLRILILNLMPTKIATETQLARLLGNTPLQVEIELIAASGRTHKNTPVEHMLAFYRTFDAVKHEYFDGMIITGAPVEHMAFEEVDYWRELCEIMEWSKSHVHSTFHICWGAQAGLYYHYGIPKIHLHSKLFGVFRHRVTHKGSILFRGSDDVFMVPHSRHTTVMRSDIARVPALKILSESYEAGVYAVSTNEGRQLFITGHSEYLHRNTGGTNGRGWLFTCRITTSRTMTTLNRLCVRGDRARTCSTLTGSTISCTNRHLTMHGILPA